MSAAAVSWRAAALAAMLMLGPPPAGAHSASDAYLTLTVAPPAAPGAVPRLQGQWDIALRDLDFVLHLDQDGDGRLTWREVRQRQSDIASFAYSHLRFPSAKGAPCRIAPKRFLIDEHADGAYAALFFDVDCRRSAPAVALNYDLFFAVDPSHRGIFVLHDGGDVATSVLSPQNARIELKR